MVKKAHRDLQTLRQRAIRPEQGNQGRHQKRATGRTGGEAIIPTTKPAKNPAMSSLGGLPVRPLSGLKSEASIAMPDVFRYHFGG